MSIAEGIEIGSQGGMTLTGDGVTFYRFLQLKSAMKMQIESGIYVGRGIRPFHIAVQEFGLDELAQFDDEDRIINKEEIYNTVCAFSDHQAVGMMDEYRADAKKAREENPPPKRVGTGGDRSFEIFDGYFTVTQDSIIDLLITAFEGGSNYWYCILGGKDPSDPEMIPSSYTEYSHLFKGLRLFAKNHKEMFVRFNMDEDYDGETGDIFLQYCLFGKVVYG